MLVGHARDGGSWDGRRGCGCVTESVYLAWITLRSDGEGWSMGKDIWKSDTEQMHRKQGGGGRRVNVALNLCTYMHKICT